MRAVLVFALVFSIAGCLCVLAEGDEFKYQVGQVWTYEHEGPQPWGTQDATGLRTRTVLRKEKVGDIECWVIEDRYERGERSIEEFIAPDHRLIQQILRGGESTDLAEFQPPLEDAFFTLDVGKEKQVECVVVFRGVDDRQENVRFRFTLTTTRLPDEPVAVSGGTLAACRRISERIVVHFEFEGTPFEQVALREAWWHPQMELVKETYVVEEFKGPDGTVHAPERKSKSVLKSFVIEEAKQP